MSSTTKRFLGKYRGTVVNNVDPMMTGRIQVLIPDVSNVMLSSWAMPCLPVGGMQMGMFTVPMIGAGVWVEFEQGDPDYPVWVGSFWGNAAEVPALAKLVPLQRPDVTRAPGGWEGEVYISDDFDAPLPEEIQAAFEGQS